MYKPVAIDEDNHFPPRAEEGLAEWMAGSGPLPIATDDRFPSTLDRNVDFRNTVFNVAYEYDWISPRSVEVPLPYQRLIAGALRPDAGVGRIVASERVIGTNTMREVDTGRTAPLDDHCSPAIHYEPDRVPWMLYGDHGGNHFLRRIAGKPNTLQGFRPREQAYQTYDTVSLCSYGQIHKIEHLCDENQDTFWIIFRMDEATPRWVILPTSLNQKTREFTDGTLIPLIVGEAGIYCASYDAHVVASNQRIRIYMGYNPGVVASAVRYIEIDVVTGSIYAPVTSDSAIANTGTGTGGSLANLPYDQTTITPLLGSATGARRFHGGRPGPLAPAALVADWPDADPNAGVYKVAEYKYAAAEPRVGLAPHGTGWAQTPHKSAWNDPTGFEIDVSMRLPASAVNGYFARQFISSAVGGDYLFNLRIVSNYWAVTAHGNAGVFSLPSTGTPLSGLWGTDVVLRTRLAMNEVGGPKLHRYYSTNGGTTWTEVGTGTLVSAGSGAGVSSTSLVATTSAPLIIGSDVPSQDTIPTIYYVEYRTLGAGPGLGTVKTRQDFVTGWTAYQESDTDPQGNVWTVEGGAVVGNTSGYRGHVEVSVPVTPGERPGYLPSSNYLPGGGWANPCWVDDLVVAGSDGTLDRLVACARESGAAYGESEALVEQPTTEGRIFRPSHPLNGGAVRVTYLNVNSYSADDFEDFDMDEHLVLS